MSLVKSSLDLTAAVLNTVNSANPLMSTILDIGQWLGREGIDRYELAECLTSAKALAHPNSHVAEYFRDLKDTVPRRPIVGLVLRDSLAIGIKMLEDPHLRWIVSTSACLFQYTNDPLKVAIALSTFVTWMNTPEQEARNSADQSQTKYVMEKIVSSIWMNVVNVKPHSETLQLPPQLQGICPRGGHHMTGHQTGKLMSQLQQSGRRNIILRSQHFLPAITLWILAHFKGEVRVVVASTTLFEKRVGSDESEIEVRVKEFCTDVGPCSGASGDTGEYELLEEVDGVRYAEGTYSARNDTPNTDSACRQALYSIPRSIRVSHTIDATAQCLSQHLMRWMLSHTIDVPKSPFRSIRLSASCPIPGDETQKSMLRVSDLLKKHTPDMLHENWGNRAFPPIITTPANLPSPEPVIGEEEGYATPEGLRGEFSDRDQHLSTLIPIYPCLRDLSDQTRHECGCTYCILARPGEEVKLSEGCKRRKAVQSVLFLVAHAVADCFGCSEASSLADDAGPINGAQRILFELAVHGRVSWDAWFGTAATVHLGCPFEASSSGADARSTQFAALQYGNLAVLAPWLDLTKPNTLRNCFRLVSGRGRIGVSTRSSSGFDSFRGVDESFAVLQTEATEESRQYDNMDEKRMAHDGDSIRVDIDGHEVKSDFFLAAIGQSSYRLLARVRTERYSRIINPSDAVVRLCRQLPTSLCREHGLGVERAHKPPVMIYSFEELLGQWHGGSARPSEDLQGVIQPAQHVLLTTALDTHLKLNVTYALSVNNLATKNGGAACVDCAVQAAADTVHPHAELYAARTGDRIVINVSSHVREDVGEGEGIRRAIMEG